MSIENEQPFTSQIQALLNVGSTALKKAALNEQAKHYLLENKALYPLIRKAADRYIGGETLEETAVKVALANSRGMKCSIEFMGENISLSKEAIDAKDEFLRICHVIGKQGMNSTVSLDCSHIGLNVSRELCLENLLEICAAAAAFGIEVNLSAEGTNQTDHIIGIYRQASTVANNLAITLQAYLHRAREDFKELIKIPGRIRIVKGAFATPEGLSMPRGRALDDAYLSYVDELLRTGHSCSIATHHQEIQQEVKKLIDLYKPDQAAYEFESLYGIQEEQLWQLKSEGYMTKLYFVYGTEWYLYLCNRLAEYPLNLFRALADITAD